MQEARRNFLVGLFVLVGLGVLGALIVLFGQSGMWLAPPDANLVNIRLGYAAGIRQGTQVTIGGLPVGRVLTVAFVDKEDFNAGVQVTALLDESLRLRAGSRARTSEPGLGMGRPPIQILPGPSDQPLLERGATIPGEIGSAMESLIPPQIVANFDRTSTAISDAATALTPVLGDLHEILQPRTAADVDTPGGPPGNISSAAARLDLALRNINEVFGDPAVRSKLRDAIENIYTMSEDGKLAFAELKQTGADVREAAEKAKALVDQAGTTVTRIDTEVQRISRGIQEDLDLAAGFLTRTNELLAGISRGEGTIGKIFTDDKLYEAMVLSFRRLAESVEEFRLLVKDWQKGRIRIGL